MTPLCEGCSADNEMFEAEVNDAFVNSAAVGIIAKRSASDFKPSNQRFIHRRPPKEHPMHGWIYDVGLWVTL